ncbi:uncharacterized protein LOC125241458 [Leguminivora glycinivorella]|uniref:uncharacterized protein LOC125241458 n=1 Tax=Leguminivora glycinivorella TaxID=1035111 RepID=UPI0020102D8A|nr:uncharacterized protein LOC125241458 [Leguminivora glycinivorella]
MWWPSYLLLASVLHIAACVKVKVVMHSDSQDDSRVDEEYVTTDSWEKRHTTMIVPYVKKHSKHNRREKEYEDRREVKSTTDKAVTPLHPNAVLFSLIYKQININSMFMFEQTWYTWSTESRNDGTKNVIYYICYKEPKHCDEIGWERTDSLPRCAFEIDSLLPDDRACINPFGVEPHNNVGCDGGEQIKVKDIVRACGPRIRSLWRFVRVGARPTGVPKPADVNSLVCEDEDECIVNVEYRIHHDRITFALYEPSRGQTFKSALKRDLPDFEGKLTTAAPSHHHHHQTKKVEEHKPTHPRSKYHIKTRAKAEGKGVEKEKNDSGYVNRRTTKNKIKVREEESEDISDN